MCNSVWPHRRPPTRLPHPWDSPGKNTGVGWHFLLQCMKVKSESEVAQSCPTLSDPMDCSLPGCSVHGIFQARVLEWGAIAFSETTTRSIQLVAIHFRNYSLLNLSSHLSLACAQVSEYLPCTLESFFSFFKIATALKLRDKRLLFFFNHCF